MEQREALERMSRGGGGGGGTGGPADGAGPDALRVFVQEKSAGLRLLSICCYEKRGTAHLAGLDSTAPSPNIGLAPFCDLAPTPFCLNSGGHSIEAGTNGAQSDAPAVDVRICV